MKSELQIRGDTRVLRVDCSVQFVEHFDAVLRDLMLLLPIILERRDYGT